MHLNIKFTSVLNYTNSFKCIIHINVEFASFFKLHSFKFIILINVVSVSVLNYINSFKWIIYINVEFVSFYLMS